MQKVYISISDENSQLVVDGSLELLQLFLSSIGFELRHWPQQSAQKERNSKSARKSLVGSAMQNFK